MNPKNLKVKIDRTPAQLELVRKLGSKNKLESMAAAEAIASILPQPILQVIMQAAVISSKFATHNFESGTSPSVDLDPYFDVRMRNLVQVWGQSQPGGTATNFVQGLSKLFLQVYPLTSAVSMNKNTLRSADLDYLGASLTKMTQEILVQQEINAANILMASTAQGRINGNKADSGNTNLMIAKTAAANQFGPDDFNTLLANYDRVIASWAGGGTPAASFGSIETILGSPEWMREIRAMAYQPINTRSGAVTTSGATAISAPDSLREEIFKSAGLASFYGTTLEKVWEMGVGRDYNTLFGNYLGSTAVTGFAGSGTSTFDPTTEEVVIGLNTNVFDLIRLRESEGANTLTVTPDDTFSIRSDKVGMICSINEGYASVDSRAKYALIF